VIPEIVELPADTAGQAASLAAAAAAADGPVVWLAPAGEAADAELLAALSAAGTQVRVLHGAHEPPGAHLLDVVSIMDTLRTSCPWDREQTHASLVRYLLEEAYEAVETVEDGDLASLREELGDVLLQVLFHARIAAERGAGDDGFTIDDVADTLAAKLIRRHPHVFGSTAVSSAADVNRNWEEIKKAERSQRSAAAGGGAPSVLDGVPFGQPALSLAAQLQRRAERAGMPGDPFPVGDEAGDAAGDGDPAEIGEELMRVVARAQAAGLDPELELRAAARRFAGRIRSWEQSG
jgi:XTP/dITP diphosphohydrolase